MKNNQPVGERGFIRMIVIIVIALLVLSYFGINLRSVVSSPTAQDNFSYVATTTVTFWDKYLKKPATYLWKDVFVDLIWDAAINNLKHIKNGEPTDIASSSPKLPYVYETP